MTNSDQQPIEITEKDLPLCCPRPGAPLWACHPRVFLEIAHDKEAVCPYCSAHYVLKGALKTSH